MAALSWVCVVVVIAAWWVASTAGLVPTDALPGPLDVARAAGTLLVDGEFVGALTASLARVLVGSIFGGHRSGARCPRGALGDGSGCDRSAAPNAPDIRDVDRRLVEVATAYRIPRAVIAVQVLLRGALPQVLTGFRFSIGIAWIALVTVEVVDTPEGPGSLLNQARQFARTEIVLVVVIVHGSAGRAAGASLLWQRPRNNPSCTYLQLIKKDGSAPWWLPGPGSTGVTSRNRQLPHLVYRPSVSARCGCPTSRRPSWPLKYAAGGNIRQLAASWGVSREAVRSALRQQHVPVRQVVLTDRQLEDAAALKTRGWSLNQLGALYGVDPKTMKARLQAQARESE
ncbi:ABC transporter permease [Rathayibacter iranicus]|uniref:ABC transporter permease n=1 Tax=Rathayibacter iranicus TaxID=59737 RepID=UPI00301CA074